MQFCGELMQRSGALTVGPCARARYPEKTWEECMDRRQFLAGAASSALALARRRAAEWPERLVKLVVPFPPAGAIDVVARLIAPKLQQIWGKDVVSRTSRAPAATSATNWSPAPRPRLHTAAHAIRDHRQPVPLSEAELRSGRRPRASVAPGAGSQRHGGASVVARQDGRGVRRLRQIEDTELRLRRQRHIEPHVRRNVQEAGGGGE